MELLTCSVCHEIGQDMSRWSKCQHSICIICAIKCLKKPFCNRERILDPKKIFCDVRLTMPPLQRIEGRKVSDCTFVYEKCLPAMRINCPICRSNPMHLFHENTDLPFESILSFVEIPDFKFTLTQCEWCEMKLDKFAAKQRIHHILYECKEKFLPCPFVVGCKVRWYSMSYIQEKHLPYYDPSIWDAPEEWAPKDSTIYTYLACLLKNHVMNRECGRLSCTYCQCNYDILSWTQHNRQDCEIKMKLKQLRDKWACLHRANKEGNQIELYKENKTSFCSFLDKFLDCADHLREELLK